MDLNTIKAAKRLSNELLTWSSPIDGTQTMPGENFAESRAHYVDLFGLPPQEAEEMDAIVAAILEVTNHELDKQGVRETAKVVIPLAERFIDRRE